MQPRLCRLYKCVHRQPKPNLCLPALLSKLSAKSTFSSHIMVFLGLRCDGTLFGYSQIQGSLNSQRYHTLLQNRVLPDVRQGNGGTLAGLIWQQDGAPPHASDQNIRYLARQFNRRLLQGGRNPLEGGTGLPAALISLYIFKYEICVVLGCVFCVFKAFFILNGYC